MHKTSFREILSPHVTRNDTGVSLKQPQAPGRQMTPLLVAIGMYGWKAGVPQKHLI